jgi:hypothetical protein
MRLLTVGAELRISRARTSLHLLGYNWRTKRRTAVGSIYHYQMDEASCTGKRIKSANDGRMRCIR